MITREELKNRWNDVKSRLHQNWRNLSEADLAQFNGTPSQLIGAIQQKTGASWNEVESFLTNAVRDGWSKASQAGGVAERYGDEASQFARDSYERVAALTNDYSQKVATAVKRRPIESLAIAVGVGIAAGALLFLSRRKS